MAASHQDKILTDDDLPLSADYYIDDISNPILKEKYVTQNITIPLKEEGEEVVIDAINDLPEDSSELCTLLTNEECSSQYWIIVAKAYANQGKIEEAINVITQAMSSPFTSAESNTVEAEFRGFLSWLYMSQESKANNPLSLDLAESENKAAVSLNPQNQNNLLAEAILTLISKQSKDRKTKFEKESRMFDTLLQKQPKNCYALMGKAKIFFYRQNYLSSLKLFQRILTLNPLLRPDPRIGIGLCYWFLDRKDLANQAWQNSIQVNSINNLEAKILISMAKFDDCFLNSTSDENFKNKYLEAMHFAKASYNHDPTNQVIHIILASFYFAKGEYEVVQKICEKILKDNKTPNLVKSDALFWIARCKLVHGDIVQAQKMFSDAIKQNELNTLARIGYGQCLVIRGEINDAIRTFEKIQESNSKILEVTYALGMLYSKTSKYYEKAINFLEKYVKIAADQNEPIYLSSLLTLSKLYEDIDISKSLEYLKLARDQELSAGKTEDEISSALLNNIGVFSLLDNAPNTAQESFEKALENIRRDFKDDPQAEEALEITLNFNIARAKEATKTPENIEDAMKLYKDILEKCPHYTNAKIRWLIIACLSENKNIKDDVEKLLEEESDDLQVRSFYGWYVSKYGKQHGLITDKSKDLESEHHRETLTKYTSHDCYALISMANVYCTLAREVKDQQKKDQYYVRAAQLYQKVLALDPKNAYAAQGIAIIFADRKQNGLALEIFRKVRDSLQDISIYLNMGHCLLEVKQFSKAIENYQLAVSRFTDGKDARILNYLGRAWLLRGLFEKKLEFFKKSLAYVDESYELNPLPSYRFNQTYVQFQLADFIRKLPPSKRTLDDLKNCVRGLQKAIVYLNDMAGDESKHPPYPYADLKLRANMGNTLMKQLEKSLEEQKEHDIEFENKLKEAKKIKEEEAEKKMKDKFKKEEENRKMEEKLIAERKELEQQQQEWNLLRLEEEKDNQDELDSAPSEKKKRGRKRKASSDVEGEADGEDYEDDKKKKKKGKKPLQKKSSLSKEFIADSDDEADYNDDIINYDAEEDEENNGDVIDSGEEEEVERKQNKIIDDEEEDDESEKEDKSGEAETPDNSDKKKDETQNEDDEDDGLF